MVMRLHKHSIKRHAQLKNSNSTKRCKWALHLFYKTVRKHTYKGNIEEFSVDFVFSFEFIWKNPTTFLLFQDISEVSSNNIPIYQECFTTISTKNPAYFVKSTLTKYKNSNKKLMDVLDIQNLVMTFFGHLFGHVLGLMKKLKLISKFMTSSTGKLITAIHILPISQEVKAIRQWNLAKMWWKN